MPYSFNVLLDIESTSSDVYNREKLIKKQFKKHRHNPSIKFCGISECYNINSLDKILKLAISGNIII